MRFLLILGLVGCTLGGFLRKERDVQCRRSHECSSTTPCCRDANGALVTDVHFINIAPSSTSGTCSSTLGGKGDVCEGSCGCKPGFECYRPMSGVCCPPMKCYNATWVEQQKNYWANCRPPTCFFPP